ncbi:hypothetical protein FISHEDRAFT_53152 [Fistulina hepatica ATCC 64428]|nr:hypothetical protein FISHEDRAFT_53152 [Fistulina hepatica ATCC 64428]
MLNENKHQKGKQRKETSWEHGWWNFAPLLDDCATPIEWSTSSIIFSAHPTEPILIGCHFSSSKRFTIPSPAPVLTTPGAYSPPSVVSAAPSGDRLFAYFPGIVGEGIGCLWSRGATLDAWEVQQWRSFPPGAGVVCATWLGTSRECVVDSSGKAARLPPCGPLTPISNSTLLLVTQAHEAQLCYLQQYKTVFDVITCSLLIPGPAVTGQPLHNKPSHCAGSVRICYKAAIGKTYADASILIAMHSRIVPSQASDVALDPMGSDTNMARQHDDTLDESQVWGEESTVEICALDIKFDGMIMSFMAFVPRLVPLNEDDAQSPNKGRGELHLLTTHLDFGDFSGSPRSDVCVYSFSCPGTAIGSTMKTTLDATRSFPDVYVTTIIPCRPGRGTGVIVCTLDAAGQLPPHLGRSKKAAKVRIGTSTVLKIPNLSDDSDWIPAPIVTSADCAGLEVPLYSAVSPNAVMFCAFSNSPLTQTPSLYALPKPANAYGELDHISYSSNSLSLLFCAALLSLRTTDDIAHVLVAQRDVDKTPRPVDAASQDLIDTHLMETLYITHRLLEKHARGAVGSANYLVAGLAIEVYRERAKKGFDLDYWRTEHDICSIAACNLAFEYCKRNSTGTGNSSWHLLALSTWIVNFLERLLRQCVVCSDSLPDVKLHAKDHALGLNDGSASNPQKTPENGNPTGEVKNEDRSPDDLFGSAPSSREYLSLSSRFHLRKSSLQHHPRHRLLIQTLKQLPCHHFRHLYFYI